jgi:outer membrane protein assembly factor BamA
MVRTALYILLAGTMATHVVAIDVVYRNERPVNARQIDRLAAAFGSEEQLVDSVTALLTDAGYLEARVESSGDSLNVETGARARLERMSVTGDSTFDIRGDGFFTRAHLDKRITGQLERLYDQGYHYATLQITAVRREGSDVTVEAVLNSGPVVQVAGLRCTGLQRSRPGLIERMLPLRRGDTLTTAGLRAIEAAAENIGYLTFRPPIRVHPQPGYGTAVLGIQFDEKKQFKLEGSGGYMPDNSTGLVWSLQAGFTNMFGGGRQASIRSERREKGHNSLDLQYRQPLFLAAAGELSLGAATRDYRDLEIPRRLGGNGRVGLQSGDAGR